MHSITSICQSVLRHQSVGHAHGHLS